MSNGLRVTYILNSAPEHNSGHTTGKKRVMANNVKWTEKNLQTEYLAPEHNSGHTTGKKIIMANKVKWTESNLPTEFSTSAQQWTHNR